MSDTTNNTKDTGPDGSPRDHWTSIGGETTRWYRHTWTIEDARAGLVDAWLAASGDDKAGWMGQDMTVVGNDGKPVGYLVDPSRMDQFRAAAEQIEQLKRAPDDAAYHPALMGPDAGDREALLIDTVPIEDALAWALARLELRTEGRDAGLTREDIASRYEQIKTDRKLDLLGDAVAVSYRLTLSADDEDAVPIRCVLRPNGQDIQYRWVIAYATPARGLYVRPGAPTLWGEDWRCVTGSGWALGTFMDRPTATEYALAIAAAVPGIDWRVWDQPIKDMPEPIRDALLAEKRQWSAFGRKESTPATSGSAA